MGFTDTGCGGRIPLKTAMSTAPISSAPTVTTAKIVHLALGETAASSASMTERDNPSEAELRRSKTRRPSQNVND